MVCVEKRYAKALVEVAYKKKCLDKVFKDFKSFKDMYSSTGNLSAFISDYNISKVAKYSLVDSLLKSSNIELVNFIKILVDNNRIKKLSEIYEYFVSEYYIKKEILLINITSANKMEDKSIKKLEELYVKKYNVKSVLTKVNVDPSLIGGLIIQIGDTYINNCVKDYLHNIENAVTNEV